MNEYNANNTTTINDEDGEHLGYKRLNDISTTICAMYSTTHEHYIHINSIVNINDAEIMFGIIYPRREGCIRNDKPIGINPVRNVMHRLNYYTDYVVSANNNTYDADNNAVLDDSSDDGSGEQTLLNHEEIIDHER